MSNVRFRWRDCALLTAALALSTPSTVALAQTAAEDAPPADTSDPDLVTVLPTDAEAENAELVSEEVIVVTGSIIERRELTTPAPLAVLDKAELDAAGVASIGEILQNLPSQSNAINVQFNNGGSGATRVSLRGLGANRTLVLVNGRRHVPGGNGANSSVDLTTIPAAVIERVEVLKDGASATYGSDAIGGVVNIITRRDFEGTEASVYTGTTGEGDGTIYDLSVATGQTSDNGNIVFAAGYYNQQEVMAGDRSFSRFSKVYDWGTNDGSFTRDGSVGTPEGTLIDVEGSEGNALWQQVAENDCTSGICFRDPGSESWRDFALTGTSDVGEGDYYNFQPENYLVTPSERYNLFSTGGYKFHRYLRGFFEVSYANRRSQQVLAPTPLFTTTEGIVVSADNIYNPFGRDFSWMARRMVEAENRIATQDISTYRAVTGLEGQLPESLPVLSSWRWDAAYNYGRTQGISVNEGRFIRDRVAQALGPSFMSEDGTPTCGTPDAPIAGCVPLDFFGGAGSITPEMLNYIQYTGTAQGYSEQNSLTFNLRGKLFNTPWGGDAALAVGAAYRGEGGANIPDPLTAIGNTTGNKTEPTEGDYDVRSGYAELSVVPVVGKPGAEWVELTAALRAFDYNTFGSDATWKVGGLWRIGQGVAMRGTYSTAFRAPSVGELYSGQADSFPSSRDPCDTGSADGSDPRSATVAANCATDGVGDDFRDVRTQLPTRVGGNPGLSPETANIFTAGAVYEPKFVPGLSFTFDYFNIALDQAVSTLGADLILSNCYSSEQRSNCDLIQRDANGQISRIENTLQNVGGTETAGLDFSTRYTTQTKAGRFRFNFEGTWLQHFDQIQADGTVVKGKNVYDLGVYPEWRFNLGALWGLNEWGAGTNLRYIHSFKECGDGNNIENVCFQGQNPDGSNRNVPGDNMAYAERKVDAHVTADLFGSYTLESNIGTSRLTLGVNNVLNQAPAVVYNGFLANSDASTYDFLGRYFYARFVQSF